MPATVFYRRIHKASKLVHYLLSSMDGRKVYRGEGDAGWSLAPSAWRPNAAFDQFVDLVSAADLPLVHLLPGSGTEEERTQAYVPDADPVRVDRLRRLVARLRGERAIVGSLVSACDRVALPVPGVDATLQLASLINAKVIDPVLVGEQPALRSIPIIPINETYAFAQHNGLPTRLLDFSDHPLKATYFAASSAQKRAPGLLYNGRVADFAIWIVEPPSDTVEERVSQFLQGSDGEVYRVLRSEIAYLHAQDGLFITCNAAANMYFLQHGNWPSFDMLLHDWSIEKVICDSAMAPEILRLLDRMGISHETMMPSYAEVAKSIRMDHRL